MVTKQVLTRAEPFLLRVAHGWKRFYYYFHYGRKSFYYGFHYGSKHFYYGFYYDRVGFWAETNRGGKIVLHFHGSIRGGPYCPYGNPQTCPPLSQSRPLKRLKNLVNTSQNRLNDGESGE